MLLPSNRILVLAAFPHVRHNEPCLGFFVLHSDSQHMQNFNTDTLPTYKQTHTHTFYKGTIIGHSLCSR